MDRQNALFRLLTLMASTAVGFGTALVLLGWLLGIPFLTGAGSGMVAMNPATAVFFLVSAICLTISTQPASNRLGLVRLFLSGLLLVGSLAILLGFTFDWQAGIDRVLFAPSLGNNRMAPNTAAYFALLGLALATLQSRRVGGYLSQAFALIIFGGSIISVLGYGYGAQSLYGIANHIPMALNTSILFAVIAFGLLCVSENRGLLAIFYGDDAGSMLIRRLLPSAVLGPCILGLFRVLGQRAGWYDTEFGAAIMVVAIVVLLIVAVLLAARSLNRSEAKRRTDADALRTAHQQLDSRTRLLQSILNSMEDGVIVVDDKGGFIQFNPAAERILGSGPTTLGPDQWATHYGCFMADGATPCPPERFPLVRALKGDVVADEVLSIRASGNSDEAWISMNSRLVWDAESKSQVAVAVFCDITERKRLDDVARHYNEELEVRVVERTNELSEANADLSLKNQENELFIYSVSHDLRSPLVNLQGFSKELGTVAGDLKRLLGSEDVPEKIQNEAMMLLDEDVSQSLHFIQTAVSRLGNIIDALLQLSRVGRVEYRWKPVDVQALVVRVVESMSGTLYDADIDVQVGALPSCEGDETALEQLFANLVGNAVKYRDSGRSGRIEVGAVEEVGDSAAIRTYYVKDNGLGIPAAHQEKIFQAFKRAHPQVATGEGMGLAIVRRTAERHGGTVWVESREGQGSTFFVVLPKRASARRKQPSTSVKPDGDSRHANRTNDDLVSGRR